MTLALVTGGNRGIGLEVARALRRDGMRVLLGSRDRLRGEAAAAGLRGAGLDITPLELDVADPARRPRSRARRPLPTEEGAASVLWAARLAPGGPTGGFFRDGQPVPW